MPACGTKPDPSILSLKSVFLAAFFAHGKIKHSATCCYCRRIACCRVSW